MKKMTISDAIAKLAEIGPDDEHWSLLACSLPAEFLTAVKSHVLKLRARVAELEKEMRDVLTLARNATPTTRDIVVAAVIEKARWALE